MSWAAIAVGVGTAVYAGYTQYAAGKKNAAGQRNASNNYQGAYNNYTGETNEEQAHLQQQLADQESAGYQGYSDLAAKLGGSDRVQAGEAGRADIQGRIATAMGQGPGGQPFNSRSWAGGGNSGQDWGNLSFQQRYAPQLEAGSAALGQGAAQAGRQDYDTAAFQAQQLGAVTQGRQTQEQEQQAQLRQRLRDQQLQEAAQRYSYKGPSNSANNLMLSGALVGTAGNAAAGYLSANRTDPGIIDYSHG